MMLANWLVDTLATMGLNRGRPVKLRTISGAEWQGNVATVAFVDGLGIIAVVLECETWRPRPGKVTIPWSSIESVEWKDRPQNG